jgi:hypothetical protein
MANFDHIYHLVKLTKLRYLEGFHVLHCNIPPFRNFIKTINKYSKIINIELEILFICTGVAVIEKKWYLLQKPKTSLIDVRIPPHYLFSHFVGYPKEILGHGRDIEIGVIYYDGLDDGLDDELDDDTMVLCVRSGTKSVIKIKKELSFMCSILNKMIEDEIGFYHIQVL